MDTNSAARQFGFRPPRDGVRVTLTEISPDVVGPCLRGGTHALWTDGDLPAARDWFDAAYRLAARAADPAAMAEAALGLAGLWVHEQRATIDGVRLDDRLRRSLALVD